MLFGLNKTKWNHLNLSHPRTLPCMLAGSTRVTHFNCTRSKIRARVQLRSWCMILNVAAFFFGNDPLTMILHSISLIDGCRLLARHRLSMQSTNINRVKIPSTPPASVSHVDELETAV